MVKIDISKNRKISPRPFNWLTLDEAAKKLNCSKPTLMKYIDTGLLAIFIWESSNTSKWGAATRIFIHKRDLEDFIQEYADND